MTSLPAADFLVFGGLGNLATAKIFPALLLRHANGQLPPESRFFALDIAPLETAAFHAQLNAQIPAESLPAEGIEAHWPRFAEQLSYHAPVDGQLPPALRRLLDKRSEHQRIFYLATGAEHYAGICAQLQAAGLITPDARIVLEKPLGHDSASFQAMDAAVHDYFAEEQIYRIDHYLGKETVQNLMILRFANPLFARSWNADAIDHVQITVSESVGIAGRAGFYDHYGALKDMVQNHLLQLLCLVAMEPPAVIAPETIRAEKLKVLKALRPFAPESLPHLVRGQYAAGVIDCKACNAYMQDAENPASRTESFVALKTHVDNWRWSGVPFYLRTGKRLKERYSEVVLQFRSVPHQIFADAKHQEGNHQKGGSQVDPHLFGNRLVIRIQPDESIKLDMVTKEPGPGGYRLKPVALNLSLATDYASHGASAYERLLMDVVRGNPTLFMHRDEVQAAWEWIDAISQLWQNTQSPLHLYAAGSDGPDAADRLIEQEGRSWYGRRHAE